MPFRNKAGVWAAALLLGAAGCNQSTEIPLAKVAPVIINPSAGNQGPPKGSIVSPDILPGPTGH